MKKIGILGGMGPESTALFYQEIIRECQKQYGAKYDSDYPEIIIVSLPIPDIVESVNQREKIVEMLEYGIRKLENAGADFITVPCNTATVLFFNEMQAASNLKMLNIIEETVKKAAEKYSKVGLLATSATLESEAYEKEGKKSGIEIILPEEQDEIDRIIMNILSGNLLKQDKEKIISLIIEMKAKGAQAIILGCTDIPVLIKRGDVEMPLLDTVQILAEATVKTAKD